MAFPTKKISELASYGVALQGAEAIEIWSVGTSRRISARAFILPIDSILTISPLGILGSNARQLVSSPTIQVNDGGPGGQVTLTAIAAAAFPTALQILVAAAGNNNDVALTNATIGFLDVNTAAGAATITGIVAPYDGYVLTINNIGANLLTLATQNANSAVANRFRFSANVGIVQNGSFTVRYSAALSRWVAFS